MATCDDEIKQSFFYFIPAQLVESGNHKKAFLYGLITSLADIDGYCQVTLGYLAKKQRIRPVSLVNDYLKELKAEGWIDVEPLKNKPGFYKIKLFCSFVNN